MALKTKFQYWVVLIAVASLLMITTIGFSIYLVFPEKLVDVEPGIVFLFMFFLFICIWLFWGELRTKAIKAELDDYSITVKRFMGLGTGVTYTWYDFEGYTTCMVPSKTKNYEFLYLMKGGKKVIKLSQFYHRNYSEVKQFVSAHADFLGKEHYSHLRELKEIFM